MISGSYTSSSSSPGAVAFLRKGVEGKTVDVFEVRNRLDLGYRVIHFSHEGDWDQTAGEYPYIFGSET